jgi:4-hydroxybenzoate polyprenyltransferase
MKNLLIFLPILAAHNIQTEMACNAVIAFLAFNFVASSVYLLNDLLDLKSDRQHVRKKNRPFASGQVPIMYGLMFVPLLALIGVGVASAISSSFVFIIIAYYITTLAYSFLLKRRLLLDIFTLAGLYTLRVVAGAIATGLVLSPWILAFCVFLFLGLAAIKRQTELVQNLNSGQGSIVGRAYRVDDLSIITMIALTSGFISVLVFALYINSAAVNELYSSPWFLWGACPVLLYWISRLVLLAHRGEMHDDPVIFATKDTISLLCGFAIIVFGLAGSFL